MDSIEQNLRDFREEFENMEKKIGQAIIGQGDVIRDVLAALVGGGNVLLEGLPGLGKTKLVKVLGQVLGLDISRIQFTPDLMPADITGTQIYNRESGFSFQPGPVFSNIILADEVNRATPKTQAALLEAMQEHTVTVGGETHVLPSPFFVLATQNPIEMEGTYPLPEAQLDRFMLKLNVGSPGMDELLRIVELTTSAEPSPEVTAAMDGVRLGRLGVAARSVVMAKPVAEYAMKLVLATHPDAGYSRFVRYGASPRGAQALVSLARIYALLEGRFNVGFDDVRAAAFPSLRHRIILNFGAISEKIQPDDVITEIISLVEEG